jgi:topoisomerase IV subunit A
MDNETAHGELHQLFDLNFLEYTSYVVRERAIPDVSDGLKPVQRRILQTLYNMDDGRYNKVANVVGDTMKLHPHGDASIFSALVNLANKGYLIDRQGNFGNIYTGDNASAARYIECRLSPLAKETLFNKDLTEFIDSYDGRMQEPLTLPAKIPLLLMQGAEGIAVGMATKILPHNFCELLEAQKKFFNGEPFEVFPDFPQGGFVDVSSYQKGNGKIKCRAKIEELNDKTILIKELPYATTTQSIIESVEKAVKAGKLKIQSINDYTAEDVEIEIKLARGIYAADTIKALYAFSDCEVSLSPNLTVIQNNNPVILTVNEVLEYNCKKLIRDLEKELQIALDRLKEKLHAHLLEQIFIEERLYKQIEEIKTYELVFETIEKALLPFADRLIRDVTRKDIERLLEIRIKRISRYDINRKLKEIKEVKKNIRKIENHLKDMIVFSISYIDNLIEKYGKNHPRLSEIKAFNEVDARKVAISNLIMGFNPKTGFLGHQVKAPEDHSFSCSEYDKLMLIYKNGTYKIINIIDKLFLGHEVEWVGKLEENLVFSLIYFDGANGVSHIKRFKSPKFILEKEYRLFPEHPKSKIQLLSIEKNLKVRIYFVISKRAKRNYDDYSFEDVLVKGASALGRRVSRRVVRRISIIDPNTDSPERSKPVPQQLPGIG